MRRWRTAAGWCRWATCAATTRPIGRSRPSIASGSIGAPLLYHSRHRNPSVPPHYTGDMAITDTAVHDFDVVRWLLDEEFVATTVLTPRRSRHGGELQDPVVILLETESGALVDVEVSVNIRYGYDIQGEVVGEDGTAALGDSSLVLVRHGGSVTARVPEDWRERFLLAYDIEFQEWIDALAAGGATGPSAWDGYAAAVVSDSALEAARTGARAAVTLRDKPDLYAKPRRARSPMLALDPTMFLPHHSGGDRCSCMHPSRG